MKLQGTYFIRDRLGVGSQFGGEGELTVLALFAVGPCIFQFSCTGSGFSMPEKSEAHCLIFEFYRIHEIIYAKVNMNHISAHAKVSLTGFGRSPTSEPLKWLSGI